MALPWPKLCASLTFIPSFSLLFDTSPPGPYTVPLAAFDTIHRQVVQSKRLLASEGDPTPLTNLVFMGMGEPLHNLEAVLAATDIMTHPLGLHLSRNKVCVR